MLNSRLALYSQLRSFVEQALPRIVAYHELTFSLPQERDPYVSGPAGRERVWGRHPLGKYRETVEAHFCGEVTIRVSSSEEKPPLGEVELLIAGRSLYKGPLDSAIWKRVGELVIEWSATKEVA
jgi:hypothetical protein